MEQLTVCSYSLMGEKANTLTSDIAVNGVCPPLKRPPFGDRVHWDEPA